MANCDDVHRSRKSHHPIDLPDMPCCKALAAIDPFSMSCPDSGGTSRDLHGIMSIAQAYLADLFALSLQSADPLVH